MKKKVHVIVAPTSLYEDGIVYRRNRLYERLKKRSDTKTIIWLYPEPASNVSTKIKVEQTDEKTISFGLPVPVDVLKFTLYPELILKQAFMQAYSKWIGGFAVSYLWFTTPIFPFLSKAGNWEEVIYDCSDLWSRNEWRHSWLKAKIKKAIISKAEKKVNDAATKVFTSSDYLTSHLKSLSAEQPVLIENGVEYDRFAAVAKKPVSRPNIGFVGSMKGKIDFQLLNYLADRLPDVTITLIGPVSSHPPEGFTQLIKRKNVTFTGPIAQKLVPAYMASLSIGLLPYKNLTYNKAVLPLKLFEYLAVGLPVIGTNLVSTKKYAGEAIYYYANDYEEFLKLVTEAIHKENSSSYVKQRQELAKEHDWETKITAILTHVLQSADSKPIPFPTLMARNKQIGYEENF